MKDKKIMKNYIYDLLFQLLFLACWIVLIYQIVLVYKLKKEAKEMNIDSIAEEICKKSLLYNSILKEENKKLKSITYEIIEKDGTKKYRSLITNEILPDEIILEYDNNL
ncbi:MAG: hypothetical protein BGWL_c2020 [Candidatus Phytoplasma cynodontis]|uniref:hypothetical protein n=1 Tax='Cynodon dactylon' phytoplasma TaxID=295320 RepID=UPI001265B1C6|nr:hypothetical protein ['Cynodon dactylon' phytoplasma]KAB8121725.1 hypothetical protein F1741_01985 ['Cynodon dactylon' phytoplasma]WIA07691.1 MAG: hypothetical protein BGWL_c2020 [Candidatus Phytoplasma cynodontis]